MEIATRDDIQKMFRVMKEDIIREISTMVKPPEPDRWMTSKDVMEYLQWGRRTFDKYRPEIPFKKIGKLMIRKSELDAWLERKFKT